MFLFVALTTTREGPGVFLYLTDFQTALSDGAKTNLHKKNKNRTKYKDKNKSMNNSVCVLM